VSPNRQRATFVSFPLSFGVRFCRRAVSSLLTLVVDGMNYSSQQQQRKPPLVRYSTQNRAVLLSSANSMPKIRRSKRAAASRSGRKRSVATSKRGGNKVRIVKGRVVVKVGGYPGTHRFAAGQLIRFVPLNRIKLAAKRVLGSSSRFRRRRRKVKRLKSRRHRRHRRRRPRRV